ncbi:MAG: hypothetical protein Q8R97_00390, partial [Brevundimonas sp.]|nr:hypothetical protein [Brevundimonas sp.]
MRLGVGGVHPRKSRLIGPWRLIGDVFDRRRPSLPADDPDDPFDYERKLVARVWGRFVGVRLDGAHRISHLLRDPSGALECLTWSQDGLTLVASDAPDWLVRRLRPAWTINVQRVGAALRDPLMASGPLLLDGPLAVAPGALQPMPPEQDAVS